MTDDPWVPASTLFGLLAVAHLLPVPLWLGFRWLVRAAS